METRQSNEIADEATRRRIERLSLHLIPIGSLVSEVSAQNCAARVANVNTDELSKYMRGKYRELQQQVYDYFNSRPDLQTPLEISKDDHRELCMRQMVGLVREGGVKLFHYVSEDPAKYFAVVEAVGSVDMSLGIKMGVQYRYTASTSTISSLKLLQFTEILVLFFRHVYGLVFSVEMKIG